MSDTGIDEPSCMQNGETCKTLTYVFSELSNFHQESAVITVITVNIICNQTITEHSECNLSSNNLLSVRIVGHNKAYITLNSSMTIIHENVDDNNTKVNWAWIGLGFSSGRDHTNLNIIHQSFNSLAILDCSIMAGEWDFLIYLINGSKFGQAETCPTMYLYITYCAFQPVHFTFFNNTISDCSHDIMISYFSAMIKTHKCFYLRIVPLLD